MTKKNKIIMPTDKENHEINAGIAADADTHELNSDFFNNAMSFDELPDIVKKEISSRRGRQKKPTKVSTTIRLPANVINHFKKSGKGWQSRISDILSDYVATHS